MRAHLRSRLRRALSTRSAYDQDGLYSVHNHDFMQDADFQRAYQRGVQAAQTDYAWHWRVHTGLWAARVASRLDGDFVECGVNRGFMSSAIMTALDWNAQGRDFYLLDTFSGIDERYVSQADLAAGALERNKRDIASGFYTFDADSVRRNFAEWERVRIIEGPIPETLPQIHAEKVCFLHLDLNCSPPEVASCEYLWDRIVPGGMILLDDYAYVGYHSQKTGMDEFAVTRGLSILSMPTGQGLLIKPATGVA